MSIDTKRWGKIAGLLKENMWDATTDALQHDCRCESCGKIITQDDIDEYEAEGGEGCPAVCTDCAEKEVRLPEGYMGKKSYRQNRCVSCDNPLTKSDIAKYDFDDEEPYPMLCAACEAEEDARDQENVRNYQHSKKDNVWESFVKDVVQEAPYIYKPFKSTAPAPMCQACGNELTYRDRVEHENGGGEGWPELCNDCAIYNNHDWLEQKKSIEDGDVADEGEYTKQKHAK